MQKSFAALSAPSAKASPQESSARLRAGFLPLYRFINRVRAKTFTVLSGPGFRQLGEHTVLTPPIRLGGERFVAIGSGVFVGPNSWIEVMRFTGPPAQSAITIGDGTSIAGFCTITAVQRVVIEPRVLMARNVYISDHSHAYGQRERAIKDQGVTGVAPVRIAEGAWLGHGVVVCPGVTIGRNAVVGANSVVRDDVPDFCVAVGAPARVVRRVPEEAA